MLKRPSVSPEYAHDHYLAQEFIAAHQKTVEAEFTRALREEATPPIKGEITLGKIRWRGIRRCCQQGSMDEWLEQRGKRISAIVSIEWPKVWQNQKA